MRPYALVYAPGAPEDADLAAIVKAWPGLPAMLRQAVLAIVRSGGHA